MRNSDNRISASALYSQKLVNDLRFGILYQLYNQSIVRYTHKWDQGRFERARVIIDHYNRSSFELIFVWKKNQTGFILTSAAITNRTYYARWLLPTFANSCNEGYWRSRFQNCQHFGQSFISNQTDQKYSKVNCNICWTDFQITALSFQKLQHVLHVPNRRDVAL